MDSDPLVPTEISPTKKYLMFGSVALVAIFLITTIICMIVKAKQYHHAGLYISAFALLVLTGIVILLNLSLPQDYMSNKAKYAMMALNICLIVVALGFLIHSFEKTPSPPCPPINTCTLKDFPEGGWAVRPECFTAERNATFITVSANRTCPQPQPGLEFDGPLVQFDDAELALFEELEPVALP